MGEYPTAKDWDKYWEEAEKIFDKFKMEADRVEDKNADDITHLEARTILAQL